MSLGCFAKEVGAGVLLSRVALGFGVERPPGSAELPPGRSFSRDRGVRKQPAAVPGKRKEEWCEK